VRVEVFRIAVGRIILGSPAEVRVAIHRRGRALRSRSRQRRSSTFATPRRSAYMRRAWAWPTPWTTTPCCLESVRTLFQPI
jgi:hypothetical protein